MNDELLLALRGLGYTIEAPQEGASHASFMALVKDQLVLDRLFTYPRIVGMVSSALAQAFARNGDVITHVAGISQHPHRGAVLAQSVASSLTSLLSRDILVLDVTRKNGGTALTVFPKPDKDYRILIVTDVLATGTTVANLLETLRSLTGVRTSIPTVVGVAAIGNRTDQTTKLPSRVIWKSLFNVQIGYMPKTQ